VELNQTALTILRRKQVEARTGLARSTIYRRMAAGKFPRQINLGNSQTIGWLEDEINAWIKSHVEVSRNPLLYRDNLSFEFLRYLILLEALIQRKPLKFYPFLFLKPSSHRKGPKSQLTPNRLIREYE
jgi:prophage regulatory protein